MMLTWEQGNVRLCGISGRQPLLSRIICTPILIWLYLVASKVAIISLLSFVISFDVLRRRGEADAEKAAVARRVNASKIFMLAIIAQKGSVSIPLGIFADVLFW